MALHFVKKTKAPLELIVGWQLHTRDAPKETFDGWLNKYISTRRNVPMVQVIVDNHLRNISCFKQFIDDFNRKLGNQ